MIHLSVEEIPKLFTRHALVQGKVELSIRTMFPIEGSVSMPFALASSENKCV